MANIRDILPGVYGERKAKAAPKPKQDYQPDTPLVYCIQQFGGVINFAQAIGRSTRQVYRWRDEGGIISAEAQTEALLAAKRLGIELDVTKLVYMPTFKPEKAGET